MKVGTHLWGKDLRTGNQEVDWQLQEMMGLIEELTSTRSGNDGVTEATALLKELDTFVHLHFSQQEFLMQKLNYPEASQHEREHELLRNYLEGILDVPAADDPVAGQLKNMAWLAANTILSHIQMYDRPVAEYFQSSQSQEAVNSLAIPGGFTGHPADSSTNKPGIPR